MFIVRDEEIIIPKNCFHFIRLICCLIVIYEHCLVLTDSTLINLNLRNIAVDVFFILSGFWVTLSLIKCDKLSIYIKKRVSKIFPQYILFVLFISIILFFFSSYNVCDYFLSKEYWKYLLFNIITLNFLQPNLPGVFVGMASNGAVNGSLWTIKIEIGFYIILPLLLLIFNKLKKNKVKISFFVVIYLLSIIYPFICETLQLPDSIANQLPAYMSFFICGVFILLYFDKFLLLSNKLIIPSVFVFFLSFITKTSFLLPISLSVIVFWIGFKCSLIFDIVNKDYSYSLYLVHFPMIQMLNTTGVFSTHPVFGFLLVLSMSLYISHFLDIFQNYFFGRKK